MPRLRGHHLICLHFFRGEGYDAGFVENLAGVLARLAGGSAVTVTGTDDVCAACPDLRAGVCTRRPDMDAEVRELDALAGRLLDVRAGERVTWEALRERLPGVLCTWRAEACDGCEWAHVCLPRMDA